MSKSVEEIEEAVKSLNEADLQKFREWFLRFDADRRDVAAGRPDKLADRAIAEHERGESTPL